MSRRVAHVISTPRGLGGAERVVGVLAEGAARHGWEVLVLNPFDEDPASSALATLLGDAYHARARPRVAGLPAARRWLRLELEAFRPALTHTHLFHALALVATLPRAVTGPRVLSQQHGDYFGWRGRRLHRTVDRFAERRFDRVAPCSHAVERVLLEDFRLDPSRIEVIHNGWSGTPRPRESDPLHPTVVCVANLRAEKNHETILRAFAATRGVVPEARLVLVGDGPRAKELRVVVERLGLRDAVRFAGAVDDVWSELAAADVFALSSAFEPLGIVVMEAMAAGLPVVATAVGGIPELVQPGVTGELVPVGDVEGMAAALIRLLTHTEDRTRMGEAGRDVAALLHDDRMVARYLALYGTLLDRPA